jgi:ribosomal protein L1
MAKMTKRMRVIREKVDVTKEYDINEAVALLKELATAASMRVNQTKTFVVQLYCRTVLAVISVLQYSPKVRMQTLRKKRVRISWVWKILLSK